MNMHKKRIARRGAAFVCAFGVALSAMPVHAAEVKSLEDKTSNLQSQLEGINQDLVTLSNKIAETEAEIEESNNEVYRLEASLQISRNNEEKQYETMKTRIKYMYEKEMLENMMEIRQGIETQEEDLKSQQQELTDLQSQLNTEQQNLQAKAAATSTDLATVNAQLQAAREAQAKQEEEAQKKAQEEAAKQASASTGNNTSGSSSNNNSSSKPSNSGSNNNSGSSSSNGKYNIPSGGLTPSKGRIWFNGHTETYYSQKVLPGAGLNIPGRHIASDGTIRDKDGYIVLASDDYPKGTVVETSLGAGKVYDSGSGKGNIDLYTDW